MEPAPAVPLSCCARTPGSRAERNELCGFPTATDREAMRRKRKRAMRRKEIGLPIKRRRESESKGLGADGGKEIISRREETLVLLNDFKVPQGHLIFD